MILLHSVKVLEPYRIQSAHDQGYVKLKMDSVEGCTWNLHLFLIRPYWVYFFELEIISTRFTDIETRQNKFTKWAFIKNPSWKLQNFWQHSTSLSRCVQNCLRRNVHALGAPLLCRIAPTCILGRDGRAKSPPNATLRKIRRIDTVLPKSDVGTIVSSTQTNPLGALVLRSFLFCYTTLNPYF